MKLRLRGALFSMMVAALAGACQEPVPTTPSFEIDVKPIFDAHCVRCHGAGGTLNADPKSVEPDSPGSGYLDAYADRGDCTLDANGNVSISCHRGALHEWMTGSLKLYLHFTNSLRMPLAPSDPLAPWEMETVDNWIAETPMPLDSPH